VVDFPKSCEGPPCLEGFKKRFEIGQAMGIGTINGGGRH